jgi:hypothetical protein
MPTGTAPGVKGLLLYLLEARAHLDLRAPLLRSERHDIERTHLEEMTSAHDGVL